MSNFWQGRKWLASSLSRIQSQLEADCDMCVLLHLSAGDDLELLHAFWRQHSK